MLSEKCRPSCFTLNVFSTYIVWQPNKDPSFIIHLMCLRCALRHSYVYYTRGCFPILISTYQYNESFLRSSPYRLTAEDPARLTHLLRDKMAATSQTIYSDAFSWMKIFLFLSKFHRSLFLRNQLTIFQHWFRQWLGAGQVTSHYLNQCWPNLLTHICDTRGKWISTLSPGKWPPICQWRFQKHFLQWKS